MIPLQYTANTKNTSKYFRLPIVRTAIVSSLLSITEHGLRRTHNTISSFPLMDGTSWKVNSKLMIMLRLHWLLGIKYSYSTGENKYNIGLFLRTANWLHYAGKKWTSASQYSCKLLITTGTLSKSGDRPESNNPIFCHDCVLLGAFWLHWRTFHW